jgi:hypothetical protein
MALAMFETADVHDHDGPLLRGALHAIERIERHEITPDEYQDEIAALFDRHPPVVELAAWTAKTLAEGRDQILYRRNTPSKAVWLQLLYMQPREVHPPHGHANLISNQVVLHGRVYLREYDRVARVNDDTVLLKLRTDKWMRVGDRIRTTAVDREVHWFGADDGPAVQLNFFIAGYQQWTFDGERPGRRGRIYFDPTGEVQADGLVFGKEISVEQAEDRFQGRMLTDFPVRRPYQMARSA